MFLLLAVCALDPQRCPLVSAQQGPFAGCVEVRAAGTSTVISAATWHRLARQESERLQQNWARLVHTSVVKEGGRCEVRRRVKALRKGSAHHDNRVINGENDDFLCSFLSLPQGDNKNHCVAKFDSQHMLLFLLLLIAIQSS
jgi:hypothetical protein